jgi:hypothetical protein
VDGGSGRGLVGGDIGVDDIDTTFYSWCLSVMMFRGEYRMGSGGPWFIPH